uniref:Endonuclease/exonuclease/phosphatase domain-containing protein n=1 Tax=Cacopsylla melanoneura TaxID=428564 RepID=A0A8D9BAN7_9HEMI
MLNNNILFRNIQSITKKCETYNSIQSWKTKLTNNEIFTIIHWNIRSINKYWDLLCAKLESVLPNIDVLILSEINVKQEEALCYHLENFKQISICRASRHGGGVMLFYRDSFQVDDLSYNFDEAENLALKLTHSVQKIEWIILAVYRPPKCILNKFLDDIDFWLKNAVKKDDNIIMIGDINVCIRKKNSSNLRYLNTLYNNTLVPLVKEITREEMVEGVLTLSSIDHINARMKRDYNYTASVINDKVADHYIVALRVSKAGLQRSTQSGPLTKQIPDNRNIQQDIETIDWMAIQNQHRNNPEKLYEEIVNKLNDIYEKNKKIIKIRDTKLYTPWVTERVKKVIDVKQKLLQIWRNNKNNLFNYERYKTQRNIVTNLIKKQKRIYTYKKFLEAKGDMQKTWSLINEMMNRKRKDPVEVTIQKNFQSNDLKSLSNLFNENFIKQITNIKLKNQGPDIEVNMEDFAPQNVSSSMYLRKARTKDIRITLKNMKKTGKGIDGIRNGDIIKNWISFVPIITYRTSRKFVH